MVDQFLRRRIRRNLNLDPIRATVGTAEGAVYVPGQMGEVWVRIRTAEGGFLPPTTARAGATTRLNPGSQVFLRYDEDGKLAIDKHDFSAQVGAGINPILNNPLDPHVSNVVNQTEILTLLSHPTTPGTMQVYMKAWPYILNGTLKIFPGTLSPLLSSYVPGSLTQHRALLITVKGDQTMGVYASTEKDTGDPLDIIDYQEALDAALADDSDNVPAWYYRIYGGQTEVRDADRHLDIRQMINVASSSGGGGGSGDVVGPGSATDNAIARFDLTTGKLIQNSGVIIDDSANVSGVQSIQLNAPNTAILSSDAFTWTQSYTLLAAQSGSADNLATINGGSTGRLITIEPSSGNAITVKHNVDNIRLSAGVDCVLTGNMALLLIYDGVYWIDVTFNGVNILTTKGDLLTRSSSAIVRQAVGADETALVADSAQTNGIKWEARAKVALSNLASVAVNTDIISDTDVTDDLGSASVRWDFVYARSLAGDHFPTRVKNTSGATANANHVGYISYVAGAGAEYKTTTTANLNAAWCVVIDGGANNADIYVATSGVVTVELNANCSAGDYLTTSTTAGRAAVNTLMRPEVFAIAQTANAGGAGGTCTARLYCNSQTVPLTDPTDMWSVQASNPTLFVATINGAPSATSVVYNAPSSGNENCIVPGSASELLKMRLWNTTRGTHRLITAVNTGTNTVTTVSSTDAWASGDTITIESQTCVRSGGGTKFIDLDFSQTSVFPALMRSLFMKGLWIDTGTANRAGYIHPFETYAISKIFNVLNPAPSVYMASATPPTAIINRALCVSLDPVGTATGYFWLNTYAVIIAAP
jgi:hypothetical protein